MTTIEQDDALEVPVDLVAIRTYAAEFSPGDGRTVDIRIVPYGERVEANDGLGGLPRGVVYTEEFAPGVFDHEIKAANRVLLDFEHSGRSRERPDMRATANLEDVVGRGLSLVSKADGFHGSFRMLKTAAADTALELVREGVLGGASVECRFLKSVRDRDGVVRRLKAKLERVALCRVPGYPSSLVLGVRTAPAPVLDEALLPIPFDGDLASRIAALGITIPDRLLAPPATDPSATADTSESTPATGDNDD